MVAPAGYDFSCLVLNSSFLHLCYHYKNDGTTQSWVKLQNSQIRYRLLLVVSFFFYSDLNYCYWGQYNVVEPHHTPFFAALSLFIIILVILNFVHDEIKWIKFNATKINATGAI